MMKRSILTAVFAAALLLVTMMLTPAAAAEQLEDGSVRVLPERLVVLDDSGRSVSANGEYYFVVEEMQPQVEYTKKIQIMNLREDFSYDITMLAQPLFTKGEIDLEKECTCTMTLDGELIYSGKITGEGTPDMRDTPLSLGNYEPGKSSTLVVTIVWNGTNAGGEFDNGHTVVSHGGSEKVRESSGTNYIHGETEFKWIFYAEGRNYTGEDSDTNTQTDTDTIHTPSEQTVSTPQKTPTTSSSTQGGGITSITGFVKTGGIIAVGMLIVIMMATLALMIMLADKKKKKKNSRR